jgi:hypothetical protein
MLLDVVMFVANLLVMRLLTGYFLDVYRRTSDTDRGSQVALVLCCVGMLVLPPTGAVLKRWPYHRWLTMFLANTPVIARVLFGWG